MPIRRPLTPRAQNHLAAWDIADPIRKSPGHQTEAQDRNMGPWRQGLSPGGCFADGGACPDTREGLSCAGPSGDTRDLSHGRRPYNPMDFRLIPFGWAI